MPDIWHTLEGGEGGFTPDTDVQVETCGGQGPGHGSALVS